MRRVGMLLMRLLWILFFLENRDRNVNTSYKGGLLLGGVKRYGVYVFSNIIVIILIPETAHHNFCN